MRVDVKRDRQRVRRPLPPLGELRLESLVPDGVEVVADVGKPIVQQVRHLTVRDARNEWRQQRARICRRCDDERPPDISRTRHLRVLHPLASGHRERCEEQEGGGTHME